MEAQQTLTLPEQVQALPPLPRKREKRMGNVAKSGTGSWRKFGQYGKWAADIGRETLCMAAVGGIGAGWLVVLVQPAFALGHEGWMTQKEFTLLAALAIWVGAVVGGVIGALGGMTGYPEGVEPRMRIMERLKWSTLGWVAGWILATVLVVALAPVGWIVLVAAEVADGWPWGRWWEATVEWYGSMALVTGVLGGAIGMWAIEGSGKRAEQETG